MKKLKLFFLLIFISIFIYWRWFSFNIFSSGDWWYAYSEALKGFLNYSTWISSSDASLGLGNFNIVLWRFPINYILGIFGNFNLAQNIAEKFIIVWPSIILGNIFLFVLSKKIFKNDISGIISVIVFNYNTYYLVNSTAFLLYSAGVWSVFSLYLYIKALERKKFKYIILSSIAFFIVGSYDFRIAYITTFIIFFYSLYNLITSKKIFIKDNLESWIYFFSEMLFFSLLNLYWILPMKFAHTLTSNSVLQRGLFGNEFLNINYAITLFHPFWTGSKPSIFIIQPIPFYFWLIPIFAFLGLLLNKKNKNVLVFGFIALLGILLTKQIGAPFSFFYLFLYKYLLGFDAFREASKFYFLIALGYSVLIGGFIDYIWENWIYDKKQILGKYFLTILIAFIFLWNTIPILNGKIGYVYVIRNIPNDYKIVNKIVLQENNYYRTLWIPVYSRWSFYDNYNPELAIIDIIQYNWKNLIDIKNNSNSFSQGKLAINFIKQNYAHNLLNISSVKYVFVPLKDIANDDNFFIYYGEPRQYYINALNKISWLKKINIGTKKIVVYENLSFKPHIYTTFDKETIIKNVPYQKIKYLFVNPTQYSLVLNHIKKPLYVNFSESYNSNWRMRVGNFDWLRVLINKNYFMPKEWHFKNDATLNSFYIDPKVICKINNCVKNSDGTYTIYAKIYFTPQSYMDLGLIISGITLLSILGYLSFIGILSLKNKYEKSK